MANCIERALMLEAAQTIRRLNRSVHNEYHTSVVSRCENPWCRAETELADRLFEAAK